MIIKKHIITTKTSRYYTLGKPGESLTNIWFVFHGYGQLSKEFLELFKGIANDKILLVAPEAMNKFYLKGFTGKIGATWMTKEDRENEINDYVTMIDKIYQKILESLELSRIKITVFGFSQGGHTAVRWLSKKQPSVNNLILWGSGIPRDVNYKSMFNYWNGINIKILFGNNDQFISKEKLDDELTYINTQKINYELVKYSGIHKVDPVNLQNIFNKIKNI